MAQRSLSVSISMPIEMDEKIAEEAERHEMDYSPYVRHLIQQALDSPFEQPNEVLCKDENGEISRNEGAA
ncbi:CopG family transcriptional regulator [Halomicrobium mukohataei]|uniref:CopG family transcriptional regulator n=1 Tax=Halomicrobium mukohataei TaxID=57705 RepID=A0A847UAU1_9EURY|nr:CopG family transcriptional regulator [Halomicrobium mukohataei]NLV09367.1 CopG family transcriptional regulator [Halomicrobium mukohataei]